MSLRNSIKNILKEESEIPNGIRRRFIEISNVLDVTLRDSYVCDAEGLDDFVEGIFYNMSEYLYGQTIEGADVYDIMEFVESYFRNEIEDYYQDHVQFCGG
jgi:hypothetical protein